MLTPEQIESREFLVSVRGYDRDEVHAFLREAAEHVRALRDQLEAAISDARAAEEMAADAEALVQRERARADTAEAELAAQPLVVPAGDPGSMFAEIGQQTQRILEAAAEAAEGIKAQAKREAEQEIRKARRQADKYIAEGERRREELERGTVELARKREEVTQSLRAVARGLEQSLRELTLSEPPAATVREALRGDAHDERQRPARPAPEDAEGEPAPADLAAEVARVAPAEQPGSAEAVSADAVPAEQAEELAPVELVAPADVAADVAEVDPEPEPPAPEPESAAPEPAAGSSAEVLAHLDTGTGVQPAQDVAPEATVGEDAPASESATHPAAAEPAATDPGALRAAALEPLHPKVVRKLKRGLQDLQNIAYERLRANAGAAEPAAVLPPEEEFGPLAASVTEFLEQAYAAGVTAGGRLSGRAAGAAAAPAGLATALTGEFGGDVARQVNAPLAATLRMGLGGREQLPALTDRVAAVFGELKQTVADELSATHLVRAFEAGMHDAWAASGVPARKWVQGREPRCPEARCRTNDQSGAVRLGDPFPSGHPYPPVHPGCTCTTEPIIGGTA